MTIDPGWLDYKCDIAEKKDAARYARWKAAPWWRKILIWIAGDSPNGANHRADWR